MARRLPPLNALRAFEAAGRHLSFTRAAGELGVTQAAVSHQIKQLEDHLGQQLFRRMTRRLLLTDAGQALLPELREGFDRLAQAVERVRSGGKGGTLTVSLLTTFALKWLMPRLPRFQARHPEIDVRLHASSNLVDFARENVDAAIRYGHGRWAGLQADRLIGERFTPLLSPKLVPPGAVLAEPADLLALGLPLLIADPDNAEWEAWFAKAGLTDCRFERGLSIDSTYMAVQAALEGMGVVLARPDFFAEEIAAGRLIRPFELLADAQRGYWLVSPASTARQAKIVAFREWLLAEAAGDPYAAVGGSPAEPAT